MDLLKAPTDEEDRSALSGAKEFLLAELTDGPMTAKQVEKSAGDAGIRERTLRRAKSMLGIRSTKEADGSWTWSLPGMPKMAKFLLMAALARWATLPAIRGQ